jgi:hypothetical protein
MLVVVLVLIMRLDNLDLDHGLSVYAMAMPFDNPYLDETNGQTSFYLDMILTALHTVHD